MLARVIDDQRLVRANGMRAKRYLTRRLANVEAEPRLEPLAGFVDQRNEGDRDLIVSGRYLCQPVKRRLGVGVEYAEVAQRLQTAGFRQLL